MIEINLVPDVKQELIRAKRIRSLVITGAVFAGLVSIGIVVLMTIYLVGVQTVRSSIDDDNIKKQYSALSSEPDLAHMLTIQHQLTQLTSYHDEKNIYSRFFDLLAKINPQAPNSSTFSLARVDSDSGTITLEGQAVNGYVAADILKKTILKTSLSYKEGDTTQTVSLADDVTVSELSYGEDADGKKVLRYTMSFTYDPAFFARSSEGAIIVGPGLQNATDSYLGLPQSLFSDRATDQGGSN